MKTNSILFIVTMAVASFLPQASLADTSAQKIEVALSGEHRSEKNRMRDVSRHPLETLQFLGFRETMHVVELWPGGGWYTEILAPALREKGVLAAASFGSESSIKFRVKYHNKFLKKLEKDADVYDRVDVVQLDPPARIALGEDGSADLVLTFRNLHNWINDGAFPEVLAAVHRVLKPGGILGVVEHRGVVGAELKSSSKKGYVPEADAIALIEKAGFRLSAKSEINANPKDSKDHPKGVWTLPPSFRMGDTDKEKYAAIGESDRMTLKFIRQ